MEQIEDLLGPLVVGELRQVLFQQPRDPTYAAGASLGVETAKQIILNVASP